VPLALLAPALLSTWAQYPQAPAAIPMPYFCFVVAPEIY